MAKGHKAASRNNARLTAGEGRETKRDAGLPGFVEPITENRSKQSQRWPSVDPALSRYFQELERYPMLRPEQEIELAKQVEELERAYWAELFSYAPTRDTVAKVVRKFVSELPELDAFCAHAMDSSAASKTHERELLSALCVKLRELDRDRLFVEAAYEAVQRLAGHHVLEADLEGEEVRLSTAFRNYVGRVEAARRDQGVAKNRFVTANLRLVIAIARRYKHGSLSLVDLIQEGNIGLMKAVERYDHSRGYRFSTYASWWIRHGISRALADKGRVVRIPVHMQDAMSRVRRASKLISARTGASATIEELAEELHMGAKTLEKMSSKWTGEAAFSLDRPVNDEDGRAFVDLLETEDELSQHDRVVAEADQKELLLHLGSLSTMERRVLKFRFGLEDEEEHTLQEVGDMHNLSRERIRQVQDRALDKIRRQFRE